jgi:hypothetical protein
MAFDNTERQTFCLPYTPKVHLYTLPGLVAYIMAVVEFNFDTASGFCTVLLRIIRSLACLIKGGNGDTLIIAGSILDIKVNT